MNIARVTRKSTLFAIQTVYFERAWFLEFSTLHLGIFRREFKRDFRWIRYERYSVFLFFIRWTRNRMPEIQTNFILFEEILHISKRTMNLVTVLAAYVVNRSSYRNILLHHFDVFDTKINNLWKRSGGFVFRYFFRQIESITIHFTEPFTINE